MLKTDLLPFRLLCRSAPYPLVAVSLRTYHSLETLIYKPTFLRRLDRLLLFLRLCTRLCSNLLNSRTDTFQHLSHIYTTSTTLACPSPSFPDTLPLQPLMTPLPRTLVLGAHRAGGLKLLPLLSPRLDIVGISGKPSTPSHLATILRSFHPPIQLITLGGAFTDEESESAKSVWEEYRREVEAKKEEYGEENGAVTALVRTRGEEITSIKKELGIEGYDAVGRAILRNLEKVLGKEK